MGEASGVKMRQKLGRRGRTEQKRSPPWAVSSGANYADQMDMRKQMKYKKKNKRMRLAAYTDKKRDGGAVH